VTSTFSYQDSDTRIFVLSALGSLLLHGLLVASLASMPEITVLKDEPPTVQVTLLPSPEVPQTPQTSTPPLQPHIAMPPAPPPPIPVARPNRLQSPTPPLQNSLTPLARVKTSPLTPPTPPKTILHDTRASRAMNARDMMKMRVPAQAQLTSPSLPIVTTRTNSANHVMLPISSARKKRSATRSLLAPSMLTTPRTLTATPPPHTGSTMTQPSILSSSRPAYPRVARESGWEGTVIVRTRIDTNGIPSQVNIRKSCGYPTLDHAAQEAVKSWAFQPAKDGNIPITKWVDIPIKFNLTS